METKLRTNWFEWIEFCEVKKLKRASNWMQVSLCTKECNYINCDVNNFESYTNWYFVLNDLIEWK